MLAFGSSLEATARVDHFLTEVCNWEAAPRPKVSHMEPDVEHTEVGRFQLTRRNNVVFLDIAVDGAKFRKLLMAHASKQAWDWGEK